MAGIKAYGAYIPFYRLSRAEISRAWGGFAMPGEKAVACSDEDSITLGIEAARDCLRDIDPQSVDGLFFATTTSPYEERMGASIMATVLDLREDIRAMDLNGSLRVGTTAVSAALDAVQSGSLNNVLVVASDCRLGAPSGDVEMFSGDGAAALLISKESVIAEVKGSHAISDEFSGVWRADSDVFVRGWETRMVTQKGYAEVLPRTVTALMEKCGVKPETLSKAVYNSTNDPRSHMAIAPQMGLDKSKLQDSMLMTIGNTGAAQAMMMLVATLEEAKPGDNILFANYGNGADAFLLQVTPDIEKLTPRRGIKKHMESKLILANYQTYLQWRGLVPVESARRPDQAPTSISVLRRHRREILGLYGVRCLNCGTPQYSGAGLFEAPLPIRFCVNCDTQDQFEPFRFADEKGVIFTYCKDALAPDPNPPNMACVVDFDCGGRILLGLTDRDPDQIEVGMTVEMAFKKLYFDRGVHNYFWKARPVRVR